MHALSVGCPDRRAPDQRPGLETAKDLFRRDRSAARHQAWVATASRGEVATRGTRRSEHAVGPSRGLSGLLHAGRFWHGRGGTDPDQERRQRVDEEPPGLLLRRPGVLRLRLRDHVRHRGPASRNPGLVPGGCFEPGGWPTARGFLAISGCFRGDGGDDRFRCRGRAHQIRCVPGLLLPHLGFRLPRRRPLGLGWRLAGAPRFSRLRRLHGRPRGGRHHGPRRCLDARSTFRTIQ